MGPALLWWVATLVGASGTECGRQAAGPVSVPESPKHSMSLAQPSLESRLVWQCSSISNRFPQSMWFQHQMVCLLLLPVACGLLLLPVTCGKAAGAWLA